MGCVSWGGGRENRSSAGVTVILRLKSQTFWAGDVLGIRVGGSILTSDTFAVAGNMPWKNALKSSEVG